MATTSRASNFRVTSNGTHMPLGALGSSWVTSPTKSCSELFPFGWEPEGSPGQGTAEGLEDFTYLSTTAAVAGWLPERAVTSALLLLHAIKQQFLPKPPC